MNDEKLKIFAEILWDIGRYSLFFFIVLGVLRELGQPEPNYLKLIFVFLVGKWLYYQLITKHRVPRSIKWVPKERVVTTWIPVKKEKNKK